MTSTAQYCYLLASLPKHFCQPMQECSHWDHLPWPAPSFQVQQGQASFKSPWRAYMTTDSIFQFSKVHWTRITSNHGWHCPKVEGNLSWPLLEREELFFSPLASWGQTTQDWTACLEYWANLNNDLFSWVKWSFQTVLCQLILYWKSWLGSRKESEWASYIPALGCQQHLMFPLRISWHVQTSAEI